MQSNACKSPPSSSPASDPESSTQTTSTVRHVLAIAGIVAVSFLLGFFLTPADPVSFIMGFVFLTIIMLLTYVVGVRNGRKSCGG
jgi:hypothetical protein